MTILSSRAGRLILLVIATVCSTFLHGQGVSPSSEWKAILRCRLSFYGHSNWIELAGSSFAVYSEPGIETLVAQANLGSVLNHVTGETYASRHIRVTDFLDKEINFVEESEYPGVSALRRQTAATFTPEQIAIIPTSEVLARINETSATYRILFIMSTARSDIPRSAYGWIAGT